MLRKLKITSLGLFAAVTVTMLQYCSDRMAGAGSETTNGIIGSISTTNGLPALNTVVKLFPGDFNPGIQSDTPGFIVDTTDDNGTFRFDHIDTGIYTVLAYDNQMSNGFLVAGISVATTDSTIVIAPGMLSPTSSVTLNFPDVGEEMSGYLYIPGTDIFSPFGEGNRVIIEKIPPGYITSVIHVANDGERRNVLRNGITVTSEMPVIVNNPGWNHERRITLNTSSEGAGITEDQYDFPVLVRLDNKNFEFSEALPGGDDLLFAQNDNTLLAFEIERWDTLSKYAEIWVKVDTVFGNDSSQSLLMYWGNQHLLSKYGAGVVFDTAKGFQGVWHLSRTDTVKDATNNNYHGISPDEVSCPQLTEGTVGKGLWFDGNQSFFTIPGTSSSKLNYPENGTYTVSAWVKADTLDGLSHVIVAKGNFQYFIWLTPIHLDATLWEFAEFHGDEGWNLSVREAESNEWTLLTGVRNGTSQYLYVNGELADTLIDFPFADERNTASDLFIGRFPEPMASAGDNKGYCFFKGAIDEIRISNVCRSTSWIKLCYMNQGANDRLVMFK